MLTLMSTSVAQAEVNYLPVVSPAFTSVARIIGVSEVFMCSGVLIKDDMVLTARHCSEFQRNRITYVQLGNAPNFETLPVARISTLDMPRSLRNAFQSPGEYNDNYINQPNQVLANDLLILHLAEKSSFPPAKLLPEEIDEATVSTLHSFLVGYPLNAQENHHNMERWRYGASIIPKPVSTLAGCHIQNFNRELEVFSSDCIAEQRIYGAPPFVWIEGEQYVAGIVLGSNFSRHIDRERTPGIVTLSLNLTNKRISSAPRPARGVGYNPKIVASKVRHRQSIHL